MIPLFSGVVTFFAFILFGLVPLLSYVLFGLLPWETYDSIDNVNLSFAISCVATAITLFLLGAVKVIKLLISLSNCYSACW